MAYNSPHTGPEIDAAVQMLGQVQDARDSTSNDLAEVKALSLRVDDNATQVANQAILVTEKTDQVLAGAAEVSQARTEAVQASTEALGAKDAATLSAITAQASEQAASQSQIAAGISEQYVAELVTQVEGLVSPIENVAPQLVPIAATEKGQTALWLADGLLNAVGIAPDLWLKASQDIITRSPASPLMMPLIGAGDKVVAWLRNGRFNAVGLEVAIAEMIVAAIALNTSKPKLSDSTRLWLYRAKIAAALQGAGTARVIFTGDSWTEHLREIAQALASYLYGAYGQSGNGWFGVRADVSNPVAQLLNGAVLSKTGTWTLYDMDGTVSNALDGHAISATGTTATITVADLKTQAFDWFYKDGDGSFRYSIDGGAPVVVTGSNTGARKKLSVTGLTDTVHTITFDLVGNTGTVMMYGGMATRTTSGVEFSKAGNGGSTSVQWQACAQFVQQYAAELLPDLAIIILGTNDQAAGISKAAYKAGLQALVNAYRAGSPNCAVLLVTPILSRTLTDMGLLGEYADAMREIAASTSLVEFIDLNGFMPPRATTLDYGLWSDTVHLSEVGGRYVAGVLMKNFLRVN